jgi:uncharacterized protein (TIGR03435 family)
VISVKRNESGTQERYVNPTPGRLSITNMTPKNLLMLAYGVRDSQVVGGPNWIDSDAYNIEAKSSGNATPKELTGTMLQSLLDERFHLKVHIERRELPVYDLMIAKRGSLLQKTPDQTCTPFDPGSPPLPGDPNRDPAQMCGSIGLGLTNLNAKQATTAALAMAFAHLLGRTVIDKTGLVGEFDGRLTFAPPGVVPSGAPVDPALPDIFTAVEEQLGLKLESSRGPVPVVLIDRIEKPTEN